MSSHCSFSVSFASLFLLLCAISPLSAISQQRCEPPALASASREQNIFTPQQEMDLGDAVAEHLQRNFRIIDDGEALGYLRKVGERIVANLPQTGIRFQFFLIDLPNANAFALPGGRIYISRKLVAFVRSEDELASIISHEVGHIASHESAIEMTRRMRMVLGVTQVGDRRDIFEKYNQLIENVRRKPEAFTRGGDRHDEGQLAADQIGLYALARAGYDPQAAAAVWDRLTETRGRTGNVFSDFFGTTKPEARRLREILRAC